MKKFKITLHIVYILIALMVMCFSMYVLTSTQTIKIKLLTDYLKYKQYIMPIVLFISILMLVEFVVQQISIYKMKGGMEDMEDEITHLKAKLYDKSQEEPDDEEENDDDD